MPHSRMSRGLPRFALIGMREKVYHTSGKVSSPCDTTGYIYNFINVTCGRKGNSDLQDAKEDEENEKEGKKVEVVKIKEVVKAVP